MEEADALDDIKPKLVEEVLDIICAEESGEGTSVESCSNADGGNLDAPTSTAPSKKRKLSDLLQNRRAHLTSQTQASFPKRVQTDTEQTKFLQDTLDAIFDLLMW
ncbi:DOCK1 [Lepeophtheirus salmonis]|uniref:DOCK1 n=1 Tax=Lepeophtheirus salmonis TaxID=72036 RepID=A0A7R8HC56_LEPSM|nr:DOCK1 [Lepeophtheirus salmonis]CAF3000289.1 DOCK1 [Lepeophtheirus salmonis]